MPFSPCKHHITFVSTQVVPSVLAASLPNTLGGARQQVEASRTAGRCERNTFGVTGMLAGNDAIAERQEGKRLGLKPSRASRLCATFWASKGISSNILEKLHFIFHYPKRSRMDFYVSYQRDRKICQITDT